MAKFATNVSGAILLPSSIQVTESISGSVVPLAMFCILCISRVELVLQFAYMIYQEKMTKMVIGGSQSRENTVKLQYCRKKELQ